VNIKLRLAEVHIPARLRLEKISELAALTAKAFEVAPPALSGRSVRRDLEAYARFTRGSADRAFGGKADLALLENRLRQEALVFGRALAASFGIRGRGQALRLIRLAYRAIGIGLRVAPDGAIVVSRCFFERAYTPETCRLIASLDEGLMAGICGGGRLEFSRRMTSGGPGPAAAAKCLARFYFDGARP
jgi:hypothetical protein